MKRFAIYDPVSKKYDLFFVTKAKAIIHIARMQSIYRTKDKLPKHGRGRWHTKRRNYWYDYYRRVVIREFKMTVVDEFKA